MQSKAAWRVLSVILTKPALCLKWWSASGHHFSNLVLKWTCVKKDLCHGMFHLVFSYHVQIVRLYCLNKANMLLNEVRVVLKKATWLSNFQQTKMTKKEYQAALQSKAAWRVLSVILTKPALWLKWWLVSGHYFSNLVLKWTCVKKDLCHGMFHLMFSYHVQIVRLYCLNKANM